MTKRPCARVFGDLEWMMRDKGKKEFPRYEIEIRTPAVLGKFEVKGKLGMFEVKALRKWLDAAMEFYNGDSK